LKEKESLMSIGLLTRLTRLTFSDPKQPENERTLSKNLLRASIQLTCAMGALALISFVFNRYLPSNSFWKPICKPMTSYLVAGFETVLTIASYLTYSLSKPQISATFYERLNWKVSIIETCSILIGLFGVAAWWINGQGNSIRFLGLGTMGFVFRLYHHSQNNQLRKLTHDKLNFIALQTNSLISKH